MNSVFHGASIADSSWLGKTANRWKASISVRAFALFGILAVVPALIHAQVNGIVCTDGEGRFTAKSQTGVTVTVEASEAHGLASRLCNAELSYHGKVLVVADDAWQADVDVMDAEFEPGKPVVGILFKDRSIDPQMTYAIYSLSRTPQLLHTIKGGDLYRAADFHFDGHIEIRTGDAAAADGFDGIPLRSFDFAPMVYLRLEHDKLVDVSVEFQPQYDHVIAGLKTDLDPKMLQAFRATNGKLDSIFLRPADEMHSLIMTKIKVLEIIWCYLYSGREAEAWRALNEMWPSSDADRVRVALLDAQKHGIRRQVDTIATGVPHLKIKHLYFYNTDVLLGGVASLDAASKMASVADRDPMAIYMRTGCAPENCLLQQTTNFSLDLRIDEAGKVVSARPADGVPESSDLDVMLKSAMYWRFIPAYKNDRPVASRTRQVIDAFR